VKASNLTTKALDAVISKILPLDLDAQSRAEELQSKLTKPPGSLGALEAIGIRLCAISGECPPPVPSPAALVVFAGDHGVLEEGVSPWPKEVTGQMVANFCAGGAAVSKGFLDRKIRAGTWNLAQQNAMSIDEANQAIQVGIDVASDLIAKGACCLITGDMGIGNTTPAAALIAAIANQPGRLVTGRGTGVDDAMLAHKTSIVEAALARYKGDIERDADGGSHGPLFALAALGGFEFGALAGFMLQGSASRIPILLDGVIADAAALLAASIAPEVTNYLFAGHLSSEPGAAIALEYLGLTPIVDLGLRLGEGSGACLSLPVLQAAAKIMREMATFDSAGISHKDEE
jgi:nicotinate-nucleotide--dimethylbenzimidazole phosphoribosyltransferase